MKKRHTALLCLTVALFFCVASISWGNSPLPRPPSESRFSLLAGVQPPAPTSTTPGNADAHAIPDGPANALASGTNALVLPQEARDLRFTQGAWRFEEHSQGPDGKPVQTSFVFDGNGRGTSTLTTANHEHLTATATAIVDDETLKIQTSRYTNATHTVSSPGLFFQCRNVHGIALCQGTDGWQVWNNGHLFAADDRAAATTQQAAVGTDTDIPTKAQRQPTPHNAQQHGTPPPNTSTATRENDGERAVPPPRPHPGEATAPLLPELLEGGAELPPTLLEHTEKAQANSTTKHFPLQGDWRYSRDFARKSDGGSVGLEFHFDKNGKGSSVLKDDVRGDARAKAEVVTLPNGTLRVKTEAYSDSNGKGYYPTFMECRPGHNHNLDCDVFNGWMRLEHGALLSQASLQRQEQDRVKEMLMASATAQEDQASHADDAQDSDTEAGQGSGAGSGQGAGQGNGSGSGQGAGAGQGQGKDFTTEDLLAAMASSAASVQGASGQGHTRDQEVVRAAMSANTAASRSATAQQRSTGTTRNASHASAASSRSASAQRHSHEHSHSSQAQRRSHEQQKSSHRHVVIPKEGTAFLKGRWRCHTGLVRMTDGQRVVVDFSFDANGKGSSTIHEQSGRLYTASASASNRKGILRIHTSDYYAPSTKSKYMGQIMQCRETSRGALCQGRSRDNSAPWSKASFTRLR